MRNIKHPRAVLRLVGVVAGVAVLVSGITFAALQSQNAVVQGSTITSATANLSVGSPSGGYSSTMRGFNFANVEPGGAAMPTNGNQVFLQNSGTSNLALRLSMNPNTFANPQSARADKIFIVITSVATGARQQVALSQLLDAYANDQPFSLGETIPAGQTFQYSLQVAMASDAVPSAQSGVSLSGIDLIFNGSSVTS